MKERLGKEDTQVKLIFWGMIAVLAAVLIPLFVIGYYNFESVDDVGYATSAELVWQETHSLWKLFTAQAAYAWEYWHTWQGTFTAEWFVTSMMGIFKQNAYYMGTWLSLGSFVVSELLLLSVVLRRVMGADVWRTGIISVSILSLQLLLTPVPSEAFYWFCGAVLYTVSYSEAVLLTTLLLLLYFRYDRRVLRWLLGVGILFLSFMVAGGTYVTLIGMLLVYLSFVLWYFYRKHRGKWLVLAGALLYVAVVLLNVLAPGNQKRLSTTDAVQMSAVKAIAVSLKEAAVYVSGNLILPCVILALLLAPLFIRLVKGKSYRYPMPFLVTFLTFGFFAAQFTPTIYTLGITGAGRIQNVYRWTFYLWLYGNELYWIGWLLYRRQQAADKEVQGGTAQRKSCLLAGWLAGGALLLFTLYVWGGDTLTSLSALQSLCRGQAQTYYNEYQERLAVLRDDSIQDAVFEPYTYYPYVLFFGDITDNPQDWVNRTVATYYGKNSVVLHR